MGSDGIPCYLLIYQCDFHNFDNTVKTEGGMHVLSIQLERGLFGRVLLASKIPWMVSEPAVTQVAYIDFDTSSNCTMSNQMCLFWMWHCAHLKQLNIHNLHFSKTIFRMIEWRRKLFLEIVDIILCQKIIKLNFLQQSYEIFIKTNSSYHSCLSIVWKWNNKNMFSLYTSTY